MIDRDATLFPSFLEWSSLARYDSESGKCSTRHVVYSNRHKVNKLAFWRWSISGPSQQFILKVGGMVNKPRLHVYPGKPACCVPISILSVLTRPILSLST